MGILMVSMSLSVLPLERYTMTIVEGAWDPWSALCNRDRVPRSVASLPSPFHSSRQGWI